MKGILLFITWTTLTAGFVLNYVSAQRIRTVEIGSNKYFFSDTMPYSPHLNWFLATQYCRSIGMDLLSMPRHEEAQELITFLQENGKSTSSYWTSGNQLGSNMWMWMTTGQPFNATFDFWPQSGAPVSNVQESCTYLQGGFWYAENCMEDKTFVCQLTRCYFFDYAVTNRRNSSQGRTEIQSKKRRADFPTQTEPEKRPSSSNPNKTVDHISRVSLSEQTEKQGVRRKFSNPLPLTHAETVAMSKPTPQQQPTNVRGQETFSSGFTGDLELPTSLTQQNQIYQEVLFASNSQHGVVSDIGKATRIESEVGNERDVTRSDKRNDAESPRKHRRKEAFSWALLRDG